MRLAATLACLATLLVAILAAPTVCRRGIPSGYNTAHGFGKRQPWTPLVKRTMALDLERPELGIETRSPYSEYEVPFSDDAAPVRIF